MAEISEGQNEDNLKNKIQIFSNTDEKLKSLGKMLNNDSSREILQLLLEKEMTANEIANQTNSSLPLALYHINQMIEAGIVIVSKTSTNGKNQPMKHYSAKSGIVILPEKACEKAKTSKLFSKSLKSILRLAAIGISGAIITWLSASTFQEPEKDYQDWGPSGTSFDQIFLPVIATGVVIIILCWIIIKKKKRN